MRRILAFLATVTVLLMLGKAPMGANAAPPALPPNFTRVALGAGLENPTAMAFDGKRIFVTERSGAIRIVRPNGQLRAHAWGKLHVTSDFERGLLGIALDPAFSSNGYVYVYYTTGPGAKNYSGTPENRVSRLKRVKSRGTLREKILLDHIPSTNGIHNAGDIHFGFDGKLYITVGESGCCPNDAQGLGTLRGKILRIGKKGGIPADNPFYNTPGARPETYAYGFRNPWRLALRALNQTYVVADVGAGTWEEIDVLKPGANYGWPLYEGPCPRVNPNCDPSTVDYGSTVAPIHWYHHHQGTEQGNVIAGGVFAENSNYPERYANGYFYADAGADWVHVLNLDQSNHVIARYDFDSGLNAPVSFATGTDGNVYVVSYDDGVIYKYVYTP